MREPELTIETFDWVKFLNKENPTDGEWELAHLHAWRWDTCAVGYFFGARASSIVENRTLLKKAGNEFFSFIDKREIKLAKQSFKQIKQLYKISREANL